MRKLLDRLIPRLVAWAQNQCTHPPEQTSFDITESTVDSEETHVKWCHLCGAVAVCSTEKRPTRWRRVIP